MGDIQRRKSKLITKIDEEFKSHKYQTAYFLIKKYRSLYNEDKETNFLMAKTCFYMNMPEETIREIDKYFGEYTKMDDSTKRMLSNLKAKSLKKLGLFKEMQELIDKVRKSFGWKENEEEIKILISSSDVRQPFSF